LLLSAQKTEQQMVNSQGSNSNGKDEQNADQQVPVIKGKMHEESSAQPPLPLLIGCKSRILWGAARLFVCERRYNLMLNARWGAWRG
jgi:hypothetical protein